LEILTWVHYQILPEPKETVQEVCFFLLYHSQTIMHRTEWCFWGKSAGKKEWQLVCCFSVHFLYALIREQTNSSLLTVNNWQEKNELNAMNKTFIRYI
jgi:hypothetical protein